MAFNATYYPVPTANDTGDILSIFQWVNGTATEGLFFPIMVLVIWIVQFIGVLAEGRPASRAWVYSSFMATVLSIMLGIMALIEQKWIYLLIILVSLGAFWIKLSRSRE